MKNRWMALVASVVICWAGAMACKGSGAPAEAPSGPGTGESALLPKSLFIPVMTGEETQFYRADIAPVEKSDVTSATKGSKLSVESPKPKHQGYQAKSQVTHHLQYNSQIQDAIGITPFNELVMACTPAKGDCLASQVRLLSKESTVDILKNRILAEFTAPKYDEVSDRVFFVVQGNDNIRHLMQRTMDGKESEVYQDKQLVMVPTSKHQALLFGSKGVFMMSLGDGKVTKLSDPGIFGYGVVGHNADYIWFQKKDQSVLVKSDGSKSYDLPGGVHATQYRPDLNELVFSADVKESVPAAKQTVVKKPKVVYRLDLQSGNVSLLSKNEEIVQIIDHVGDQYLVTIVKNPSATQMTGQFGWLKPDGSFQEVASVTTGKFPIVMGYNPQNQVLLVQDGDLRLNLVSLKEGKVVATLENTFARPTYIFPMTINAPVLVTFQAAGTPGAFNVGLISPDTLGGADGKDFGLVSLGTIDTKHPGATIGYFVLDTDIHDTKARAPAAVADNTPPPKPEPCVAKCDGKQCGDDGCGGSCGTCAEGKVCSEALQCVAKAPAGPAPMISGINTGVTAAVLADTTKKFVTPVMITSDVGLTAVTMECGDGKMEGVPAFDPAAHKNKYEFQIQLSSMKISSVCMIKATDAAGQSAQVTIPIMIGTGGVFQ